MCYAETVREVGLGRNKALFIDKKVSKLTEAACHLEAKSQIVPIADSAMLSFKIVKGATLKVYPGLPHGMCSTHKDQVNADLLAFLKA